MYIFACVYTAQTPQAHIHPYTPSFKFRELLGSVMTVSGPRYRRCEAGDRLGWVVTVWGRMPLASFAETQVTDDVKALVTHMVT